MSGDDGVDFSTQVPVVRCAWVPVVMTHYARHSMLLSPKDPAPAALPSTKKPPDMTVGCPGTF
jgi:hypothetical protein